jgi:hypothetical protein
MGQPLPIQGANDDDDAKAGIGIAPIRVLLAATVYSGINPLAVRLRSISRTGALIGSAVIPPAGSLVRFERGSVSVSARVVATGRSSFELKFREAIDEQDLLIVVGRPLPREPLGPLFPLDHYLGRTCEERDNSLPISKH